MPKNALLPAVRPCMFLGQTQRRRGEAKLDSGSEQLSATWVNGDGHPPLHL